MRPSRSSPTGALLLGLFVSLASAQNAAAESWAAPISVDGPTDGAVPAPVSMPTPKDNAVDQLHALHLAWAPASGAQQYAVYLGEQPELTTADLKSTQTTTEFFTYKLGELTRGARYYWRVDSINEAGVVAGPVWQFHVAPEDRAACHIRATPRSIVAGQGVTLVWSIYRPPHSAMPSISIDGDAIDVTQTRTGSTVVFPTSTITYTMTLDQGSHTTTCTEDVLVSQSFVTNALPEGAIEAISEAGVVSGRASDPNAPGLALDVLFYVDGPQGNGRYMGTGRSSPEGTFSFTIPDGFRDGHPHALYAHVEDADGGADAQLAGTPIAFRLPAPAATCQPLQSVSAPWTNLDFENGGLVHRGLDPSLHYHLYDYEEERERHRITVNDRSRYSIWLSQEHKASGCRSLAFDLSSETSLSVQDRVELTVVEPGRLGADLSERRYLSFDMMFDTAYEIPKSHAIHMQVWQPTGNFPNPPLSMSVVGSRGTTDQINLRFAIYNDDLPGREIYETRVDRGRWYRFCLSANS